MAAKSKDISVIIPIERTSEDNMALLRAAMASVPKGLDIYISTTTDNAGADFGEVKKVVTCDDPSFASLVNNAVSEIDGKWFTVLEYDDTMTKIWLKNIEKYTEAKPDVSVFMFLEDISDFNTGKFVSFGNEAAWASSFSNEIGYIDNDCLQNFFDFYMTGSLFNKDDWENVGGLKKSIKVTFWYEWMLRLTSKGHKIYVIPKIGYNHRLGRKGSLTEIYKAEVGAKETQWWFDRAKIESVYKEDRNKTYREEEDD